MNTYRRALLHVVLGLTTTIACGPAAFGAGLTLDQLMQSLATVRSGRATFVEERRIVSLDPGPLATPPQVLRSTGVLSFDAPDRFERRTLKPRDERLLVDGNTLTMSRGSRTRTVQLDSVPEAQAMVEAVRGTLTGNGRVLERWFDARIDGTLADWRLDLLPKDASLRGTVRTISLRGRASMLREVTLRLVDGDSSVMTIEAASAEPSATAPASAAQR